MVKKTLGLLILVLLYYTNGLCQNISIKGIVIDSSANIFLENASVILLQGKDSFIIADTRTDKAGRFVFSDLPLQDSVIVFFSYPNYVSYSHKLMPRSVDLKKVNLMSQTKLLEEVIVKSQVSAIKIKGDTTEYKADSFKVQPNATVEDLLKQLPGLQVDQFGNITAQGQKVKKVLVDGEEFFGDDPTLVTRNLRADMIDKVQIYDKKSDAAAFTGIDDGVKDKTINLKIKEDKNHGVFGKIESGIGTDKHYFGQGMLNKFKGKRKIALYGTAGNIGRIGLGTADREKIGAEGEGNGDYNGKGLPKSVSGGGHFGNIWNSDKESINGNYKYSHMDISGYDNTVSQNNLPNGLILSNSNYYVDNHNESHTANGKYIYQFDTTSKVTFYLDGNLSNNRNSNNGYVRNMRGDSSTLYNTETSGFNNYDMSTFNTNLSWEKKLKKYGRTISFYLNNNFSHDESNGKSFSNSQFYDTNGSLDSTRVLNLERKMNDGWRTSSFKTLYTEPLSNALSLILSYELSSNLVNDSKLSYDISSEILGNSIDHNYSSKVNTKTWCNLGGAAINFSRKKIIFKAGNNLKGISMDIENILDNFSVRRQYINWNPSTSFQYKPNQFKSFYIGYEGKTKSPERSELLPYSYFNTQVISYLPNLTLKNSFNHTVTSYYYVAKNMGQIYMGGNLSYGITSTPISLSILTKSSGVYTYRYENITEYNNSNYWANAFYGQMHNDWKVQIFAGVNGGKLYNKIDYATNRLTLNTFSIGTSINKTKIKKYDFAVVANGGLTENKSSLQPETKNNYFFYTLTPSGGIYLFKNFQLHSDLNYFWQQKTQTFNRNFHRLIWNAWVGKSFFKSEELIVKISCNDILNENNGFSRTATNTFFSENRFSTIKRFFMIGAVWSFTKFNNLKQ